jgi:nitrile hydratase subunit beta
MDGVHDMGGVLGYGPVLVEPNEPVFHEPWEGLAFALNMVSIGNLRAYNADAYRHSVERIADDRYLAAPYYERLLTGVSTLLIENSVVELQELESLAGGSVPLAEPVALGALLGSDSFSEAELPEPKFVVGQTVRVVASFTEGHTRCPAYIRDAVGFIERVYPLAHVPEVRAHSLIRCREHTYAVTFLASELWPGDATLAPQTGTPVTCFEQSVPSPCTQRESSVRASGHTVIVEVFESYLAAWVDSEANSKPSAKEMQNHDA